MKDALLTECAPFWQALLPQGGERMKAWQEVSIGINQEAAALYAILAEFERKVQPGRSCPGGDRSRSRMGDYFRIDQHGRYAAVIFLAKSSAELAHLKAKIDELRNYGLDPVKLRSQLPSSGEGPGPTLESVLPSIRIGRIVVQPHGRLCRSPWRIGT